MALVRNGKQAVLGAALAAAKHAYDNYAATGSVTGSSYVDKAISSAARSVATGVKRMRTGSSSSQGTVRHMSAKFRNVKQTAQYRRANGSARLAGKLKKSRRNPKKTSAYKYRRGVSIVKEIGFEREQTDTGYIGHITHPQRPVLKALWMSILKELLIKSGFSFDNPAEQVLPFLATDEIRVWWKRDATGTVHINSFFMNTTSTLETMAELFLNPSLVQWYSTSTTDVTFPIQEMFFDRIAIICTVFNPRINSAYLDMKTMRVHYNIKSALKVQNRTLNAAGDDDIDDVDNVPIYGKKYEGSGTGARMITNNSDVTFYGDNRNGLIIRSTSIAPDNYIREPPAPHLFTEVKKWSKVSIQPGSIKTSILSSKGSQDLNNFHQGLMLFITNVTNVKRKVGKFSFMALEKVIDSTESSTPIKWAGEIQWNCDMYVTSSTRMMISPMFTKEYVIQE